MFCIAKNVFVCSAKNFQLFTLFIFILYFTGGYPSLIMMLFIDLTQLKEIFETFLWNASEINGYYYEFLLYY